jgi:acetyl esterase/lipase
MKKLWTHILVVVVFLPAVVFLGCASGYTVVKGVEYRAIKIPDNTTSIQNKTAGDPSVKSITVGKLTMDVYLPEPLDRNKHYAGVLFLYGCGWHKQSFLVSRKNWKSHGIELAKKGYIGFAIDYRLSPEFFYPAPNKDAQFALDLITGKVNPEFIAQYCQPIQDVAIVGFSSGGNIAALMGTGRAGNNREHVRCIAVYAGPMDVRKNVVFPKKSRLAVDANYLAGQSAAAYAEASPLCNADKAFCPFLLQVGKNDSWIPVSQIEAMYEALHKQNIPVEKQLYDRAQHGFQFLDIGNGPAARTHTIDFITRYLPAPH